MNAPQFVAKWGPVELTERSAYQQHFLDLCELVGHEKPAEVDPTGDFFTFERGVKKPTSDVVTPWSNGKDVTGRNRDVWIVDFGIGMPEMDASLYEPAF